MSNILDVFREGQNEKSTHGSSDFITKSGVPRPQQPPIINVPEGAATSAYRQNDALVSFNYILTHGNAPALNNSNHNLNINLEVDDAYNQAMRNIRETVTNRITNPDPTDTAAQAMKALHEKQPWSMEDRVEWEHGLSNMVSDEMAKTPGLDRYRTSGSIPAPINTNPDAVFDPNVNTISVDITGGTNTREFDCDTMSFTEGLMIQNIENNLLPANPSVVGDLKYSGDYYIMPNNVSFSMYEKVGYHATIASSVTGNVIEGTAQNGSIVYHESANPNYTFTNLANGEPFVGQTGHIYSFGEMTDVQAGYIRLANGDYNDRIASVTGSTSYAYLPDGYQPSPIFTNFINIRHEQETLKQRLDNPATNPEERVDIENRIQVLDASINNIFAEAINGGYVNDLLTEINIMATADAKYTQYQNIDLSPWKNVLSADWNNVPIAYMPEGFETSASLNQLIEIKQQQEILQGQLKNSALNGEEVQDVENQISALEAEKDSIFQTAIENNEINDLLIEINIMHAGNSSYNRYKNISYDDIKNNLNPDWEDVSENMEFILNHQKTIEQAEEDLKNGNYNAGDVGDLVIEIENSKAQIEGRIDQMIKNNTYGDFQSEIDALSYANPMIDLINPVFNIPNSPNSPDFPDVARIATSFNELSGSQPLAPTTPPSTPKVDQDLGKGNPALASNTPLGLG